MISYFLQRKAVSPDTAVPWVPARSLHQRILNGFIRRGVVGEEANETYFVEVAEYDRSRKGMRRRTGLMLVGVAVAAAVLSALV